MHDKQYKCIINIYKYYIKVSVKMLKNVISHLVFVKCVFLEQQMSFET